MSSIRTVLDYATANKARYENDLIEFLKFPSISASPQSRTDILQCAEWLAGRFRAAGLETEITPHQRLACGGGPHRPTQTGAAHGSDIWPL
ncbi:MAG: hypothetical protein UZ16_OP3001003186 [Candidatus Hinthialibacteria bacterium OLB16]|nr:MAG: hypothetical protein UZ16_OP3001003186 [Candidatus Hinthialibacteria bacterium OLB16]